MSKEAMLMKTDQQTTARYIDLEGKILITANNLYMHSLDLVNASFTANLPVSDLLQFYTIMYSHLQESLLFGKAEAAVGMAVVWKEWAQRQGIMPEEEIEKKRSLLVAVGSMLGDKACDEIIPNIKTKANYNQIEEEAAKWVKIIQKISAHYPDKDAMITAVMKFEAQREFNDELPGRLMLNPIIDKPISPDDVNQPTTSGACASNFVVNKPTSILTKIGEKHTAQKYQEQGEKDLILVAQLENTNISSEEVDICLEHAYKSFWYALALGSEKAPLSLFKCTMKAMQVKQDAEGRAVLESMATLMYGAALKLTPKECTQIPYNERPIVSKNIQPKIKSLINTIKEVKKCVPKEGVDDKAFDSISREFDDYVKGITGTQLVHWYFEHSSVLANYHEQAASSSGSDVGTSIVTAAHGGEKKVHKREASILPHKLSYSASIFAEAKSFFEETHSLFNTQTTVETFIARNKLQKATTLFIEALALGEKDATEYLACICYNYHDYGIEKNEQLTQLFIAIGEILGSTVKMPFINSENYITTEVVENLKTRANFNTVLKVAQKYAEVITNNQKKYSNKPELTTNNITEAVKRLEEAEPLKIIKQFRHRSLDTGSTNSTITDLDDNITLLDPAVFNRLLTAGEPQENVEPIGADSTSCGCCSCVIM
ncbi:hypothetical protein [Candidatus Tisiphia endosymbiont of Nemotelus uliginosus]|uniref:hypothetical protein n=1 Tax=Candidatus Tisiphia endosymbiont of Nemotelus uliginosus TaxID=3077926 RepID=UPI0035C8CAC2